MLQIRRRGPLAATRQGAQTAVNARQRGPSWQEVDFRVTSFLLTEPADSTQVPKEHLCGQNQNSRTDLDALIIYQACAALDLPSVDA